MNLKTFIYTSISAFFLLCAASAFPATKCNTNNTFALTSAAQTTGFTLVPIITGIPVYNLDPAYTAGVKSAVELQNGNIMVSSSADDIIRVYSNSETVCGSKLLHSTTIAGSKYHQLATLDGHVYIVLSNIGLVELDDKGQVKKTIVPGSFSVPLAAAPGINSLIFSTDTLSQALLVTGLNGGPSYQNLPPLVATNFATGFIPGSNFYFDSISTTLYSEVLGSLVAINTSTNLIPSGFPYYVTSPYNAGAYGISKISGPSRYNGLMVLNNFNRSGQLWLFEPTSKNYTIIAQNASEQPGNLAGHSDGSLLVPQGGTIYKLRCPGCSFYGH